MRYLIIILITISIHSNLFCQDLVAWAPSTNNLTEGSSLEHIVTGVGGSITIMNDGGDGIGNIQISIYDNINVFTIDRLNLNSGQNDV